MLTTHPAARRALLAEEQRTRSGRQVDEPVT